MNVFLKLNTSRTKIKIYKNTKLDFTSTGITNYFGLDMKTPLENINLSRVCQHQQEAEAA